MRKQKIVNTAVLLVIFCFIIFAAYNYFINLPDRYILSLNFYIGILFWGICLISTLLKKTSSVYLILAMLLLYLFNVISFGISTDSAIIISHRFYDNGYFTIYSPGLEPFGIVLFVIYFILNKNFVIDTYFSAVHGSEKDVNEKFEKERKFYLDKFSNSSDDEFDKILSDRDLYPVAAKEAIDEIRLLKGK